MAEQEKTLSFVEALGRVRRAILNITQKASKPSPAIKRKRARARLPSPLNTVRYGLEYESLRGVFCRSNLLIFEGLLRRETLAMTVTK
jgi:hypothetical protein